MKSKGQRPTFRDLVEFLQERENSENNPLYGNLPTNPRKEDIKSRKRNVGGRPETKISSYATQFHAGAKPSNLRSEKLSSCPSCHGDHRLLTCKKFLNESIENRRKTVLQARLCFQCLQPGHFKRYCRNEKCQVQDCGRRHHKLLHWNIIEKQKNEGTNKISQVTTRDATVQTNASNVAVPNMYRGTTALPVVAVTVHGTDGRKRTTYALLDQASEASFISSTLARRLNLTGSKGTMSVSR